MTFVQDWGAPLNGGGGTATNRTGPLTTPGNDLFFWVATRLSAIDPDSVVVTDDSGTNVWTQIGWQDIGSANLYLFHCSAAAAIVSVTASFFDGVGAPMAVDAAIGMLQEHSNIGVLVDVQTGTVPDVGGFLPDVVPTAAGQTVVGAMSTGSTSRSFAVAGADITPSAQSGFQGNQLTLYTAHGTTNDTTPCGIGWNLTAGTNTTIGMINAVFEEGSGAPDPLTVSVGPDQSIYIGQNAGVGALPAGGSGDYTYAWTRVAGPAGTFQNPNQASTTFTPSGGAGVYVLRCLVGDGVTTAQDDLELTVSAAPSNIVTIATVNNSTGWEATGGSVQQVLSDTSDTTLITSADSSVDQVLDVTLNPISLNPGVPFVVMHRSRRTLDAATATLSCELYDGSTLLATRAPASINTSTQDYTFVFPASEFPGVTFPFGFRVVIKATATPVV